jgi:hypothetical protein
VFAVQVGIAFALWVGYGVYLRRHSDALREKIRGYSRGVKVAFGSVGFFVSATVMLGSLVLISRNGGLQNGQLLPWAWLLMGVAGLVFVHLQVMAAASMISLVLEPETKAPGRASKNQREAAQDAFDREED